MRRAMLYYVAAVLAPLALHCAAARADTGGTVLAIGIGDACATAAHALADRLTAQGQAAQMLANPAPIDFRRVLDDLAAGLQASPRTGLLYVCAPAAVTGDRLFAMPAGTGPADGPTQAVAVQALLNALASGGGTVIADLHLVSPSASDADSAAVRQRLADRLPAMLHLALALDTDDDAGLGRRFVAQDLRADAPWSTAGPALADALPAGQVALFPPPQRDEPKLPPPNPAAALDEPATKPGEVPTAGPTADNPPQPTSGGAPAQEAPPSGSARPAPQRTPSRRTAGQAHAPEGRVARLQRALLRHGLYPEPITGRMDVRTRWGIRLFQRSLRNPETGVLTQPEIIRLLNE